MSVLLPSYRNQSIDLHNKSIDQFLCERNTGIEWVKFQDNVGKYSPIFFFGRAQKKLISV